MAIKNLILIIIGLVLPGLSCKKDEAILANCPAIANAVILSEPSCTYREVYRYKGAYYTLPKCCNCRNVYMAFDCNDEALCALDQNCMDDFAVKAEFLFTVSGR